MSTDTPKRTHVTAPPLASTLPADLYNCRTGKTKTYRCPDYAKKAARKQRASDSRDVHWILMDSSGNLFRSGIKPHHCGSSGTMKALTWRRIMTSQIPEAMKAE